MTCHFPAQGPIFGNYWTCFNAGVVRIPRSNELIDEHELHFDISTVYSAFYVIVQMSFDYDRGGLRSRFHAEGWTALGDHQTR